MSQHISDDLPRLLTGDAGRDETLAAAEHLRGCPDCQQELVSAVIAHAALTSAGRFAPRTTVASERADEPAAAALPDLSAVFAKVRDEAAQAQSSAKRRRVLLIAAAAAVVATAAGITIAETIGSPSESTGPSAVQVALGPYDEGKVGAEATLIGAGTMRIDASALPRLDPGEFYEVWLTNGARTRLQPVGSLSDANDAQLTVSPKVMGQYSAIEVSIQRLDETTYSGHSVLRGSYG